MTIFAIIGQPDPNLAKLGTAVQTEFPGLSLQLDGVATWLVSSDKTAKDVSEKLGVTTGTNGAAVVIEVASYFGRANPNIWSWITSNWEVKRA